MNASTPAVNPAERDQKHQPATTKSKVPKITFLEISSDLESDSKLSDSNTLSSSKVEKHVPKKTPVQRSFYKHRRLAASQIIDRKITFLELSSDSGPDAKSSAPSKVAKRVPKKTLESGNNKKAPPAFVKSKHTTEPSEGRSVEKSTVKRSFFEYKRFDGPKGPEARRLKISSINIVSSSPDAKKGVYKKPLDSRNKRTSSSSLQSEAVTKGDKDSPVKISPSGVKRRLAEPKEPEGNRFKKLWEAQYGDARNLIHDTIKMKAVHQKHGKPSCALNVYPKSARSQAGNSPAEFMQLPNGPHRKVQHSNNPATISSAAITMINHGSTSSVSTRNRDSPSNTVTPQGSNTIQRKKSESMRFLSSANKAAQQPPRALAPLPPQRASEIIQRINAQFANCHSIYPTSSS
ncbi:hypothetical protein RUND412_002327 [Rhizina undulata]